INLPRTTYAQIKLGREVSVQEAQPGDLVFSNFSSPGTPEHVQMYLGDGKVVEAQQEGVPVLVSPLPKGNYTIKHVTKEDTSSTPD
ncbi:C40 family peptidase, partial [Gordonia otitidis]